VGCRRHRDEFRQSFDNAEYECVQYHAVSILCRIL
jgi:hypothetical protein